MSGLLVVPSIDSRPENVELVLQLLDNYGKPISQNEFAEELRKEDRFKNVTNIHSLMRKTELPRYFGLVNKQERLELTHRGYRYLSGNDDEKIDIIFESLLNDTFGRNNNGIHGTDSDIEAPCIFLKAIKDLDGISSDEFTAMLYLMHNAGQTYEQTVQNIIDYRINHDLEIIIDEIKDNNFYRKYGSNNKIRGFFEKLKIVNGDNQKYIFSKYTEENHMKDIQSLRVVNTENTNTEDISEVIKRLNVESTKYNQMNQNHRFYLSEYEVGNDKEQNGKVIEQEEFYNEEEDKNEKLIDWSEAERKNEARKSRHRELNDEFHKLLIDRGFRVFEGNIDCLGFKNSFPIIIGEVKTLSGESKDEKSQVLKAFSQLYYYEMFAMKQFEGYKSQKIAIFESKISDDHINFLESNNILVLWKCSEGIFDCSDDGLEFFKELNVEIEM